MGGSSGGLRWTITPGTGNLKSSALAKGAGPNVFIKKVMIMVMWTNGVRIIHLKFAIYIDKYKGWKAILRKRFLGVTRVDELDRILF